MGKDDKKQPNGAQAGKMIASAMEDQKQPTSDMANETIKQAANEKGPQPVAPQPQPFFVVCQHMLECMRALNAANPMLYAILITNAYAEMRGMTVAWTPTLTERVDPTSSSAETAEAPQ